MNRSSRQSGSAIVLILVAVAMFAALSFAVMRGGAGSAKSLTDEQARLAAADIIAYGDVLAKTAQTLKLRGCVDTQFDFATNNWVTMGGSVLTLENYNNLAPLDNSCDVFKPSGGNASANVFPVEYFLIPTYSAAVSNPGSSYVGITSLPSIGTNAEDIVWLMPFINTSVCLAINKLVGIDGDAVPSATWSFTIYSGVFSGTYTTTDTDGKIAGKSAFCAKTSVNRFYRVLVAR